MLALFSRVVVVCLFRVCVGIRVCVLLCVVLCRFPFVLDVFGGRRVLSVGFHVLLCCLSGRVLSDG